MDPEHLLESGRILLLAAHPDDEVIGAGARLPHWKDRILLLHATDGAPRNGVDAQNQGFATREEYARARRAELLCAVSQAGIGPGQCREIGIPDQDTVWELPRLALELRRVIDEFQPEWLLTHPYEGGHPDHDCCAFAARVAAAFGPHKPLLVEFTSYHAGPAGMITGQFLGPAEGERIFELDEAACALKRRMYDCHRSQRHILQYFPIGCEKFRRAPDYDFTSPPHEGRLHYESLNWGIDGALWRNQVQQAMEELGIYHATHGA
jgi:LmbE family N-acetylglucosaminyl deacetylase